MGEVHHLLRRAREALAHCPHLLPELYRVLEEGSWEGVKDILGKVYALSINPREQNRLRDFRTYLARNWERIVNSRRFQHLPLGVSAEAHVSHVLTARLLQRPMAWSKKGIDRMRENRKREKKPSGRSPGTFQCSRDQ